MQALILAAGMGRRLRELTRDNTKCMVQVNGVTLIERMLRQLDALSLSRIVIVKGYEGQKLIDYISTLPVKTPVSYVHNPIYDQTNNIYSLYLASDYLLEEDTLLLESDLIFEDSVLRALVDDPRPTLALVDRYESWMDGTCIKINRDDTISAFVPGKDFVFEQISEYYKTVNIYKFSREFSTDCYVPFLKAYCKALGRNQYYEQVLRVITLLDDGWIRAKRLEGQRWYEIDDVQDLDIASSMFCDDEREKLGSVQGRYGGYWRYPSMLDFCYLVNPYYPCTRLMDEIKANFETLLTSYPSGMRVNSLLAAKNFNVHQEHILVGNGALELIRAWMARMKGERIGFIRPTFEEYPNRCAEGERVAYMPDNADFSYDAAALKTFFADKDICALVLINPDNPSGNYIPRESVLELAAWCGAHRIRLIVDESFVDFADERDSTLLSEEILQAHPNLIVMKSISKSYGVPGLRIGIMASADEELIADMKKDVAIWNINSFAEFYLQIAEKYDKDYRQSLVRLRAERKRFTGVLSRIEGVRVVPSQANYVMLELTGGVTATELTSALFQRYGILIKDLSGKCGETGSYVRVAIRSQQDNDRLAEALKACMQTGQNETVTE